MRQARLLLGLSIVLLGCQRSEDEPGEVAALTKGYIVVDNWGKRCGVEGVEIALDDKLYLASGSVLINYEGSSESPLPVWIRYQLERPDSCALSINRIKVLSIRKRK